MFVIKLSAPTFTYYCFGIDFEDILVIIIKREINRKSAAIAFQKGFSYKKHCVLQGYV